MQSSMFEICVHRLPAYCLFIQWAYNHLGKGVQKVIHSCVVVAVTESFPEASNVYTGFKISDLKHNK